MLTKLLPGSPVNVILGPEAGNDEARAAVEERLGLDEPVFQQYLSYIHGVVFEQDLGKSYSQDIPTTTYLAQRLPATLELMILAQVISLLISVPLALFSAYRANSRADKVVTAGAFGLHLAAQLRDGRVPRLPLRDPARLVPGRGLRPHHRPGGAGRQPQVDRAAGRRALRGPDRRVHPSPAQRPDRHPAGGLRADGPLEGAPDLAHPAAPRPAAVLVLPAHGVRASTSAPSSADRSSSRPSS